MIKKFKIIILLSIAGTLLSTSVKAEIQKSATDEINEQDLLNLVNENDAKKDFVQKDWGNRNPFDTTLLKEVEVSKSKGGGKSDYPVQGIFLGTNRPSAIISDKVVGAGDVVKGLTIKSINDKGVLLVNEEGKEVLLTISKEKE